MWPMAYVSATSHCSKDLSTTNTIYRVIKDFDDGLKSVEEQFTHLTGGTQQRLYVGNTNPRNRSHEQCFLMPEKLLWRESGIKVAVDVISNHQDVLMADADQFFLFLFAQFIPPSTSPKSPSISAESDS